MSLRFFFVALSLLVFAIVGSPLPTFAQTFEQVVNNGIVPFFDRYVIPLLYALMFLLFIFGMFRYFFTGGEENRAKGRAFALWSLIGMVAVFSIWGVVNVLLSTLSV
jgi:hypothetical protein